MIRALGIAAALGIAGLFVRDPSARVCRLPMQPLATSRDTAAWCAREFLIRNGYTVAPASTNAAEIALEPGMDVGRGLDEVLDNRRNTVSAVPVLACSTSTGYVVSFTMPNQLDQVFGRGVSMTLPFLGVTLMRPWVRLGSDPTARCSVPRLPSS